MFLTISPEGDRLADALDNCLHSDAILTRRVVPDGCGDLAITLQEDALYIEGEQVHGLFFRTSPNTLFSGSYAPEDQAFCNTELSALWLTAVSSRSVFAVNRYDAAAWFDGFQWSCWRRRLQESGIEVSPCVFGENALPNGVWLPYGSPVPRPLPEALVRTRLCSATATQLPAKTYLALYGRALSTDGHGMEAARALAAIGIDLAEFVLDQHERIMLVNPLPVIGDEQTALVISQTICEQFYAHLYRG